MWFILEKGTEKTIAMTAFRDIAEIIATSVQTECIIRYAEKNNSYSEDSTFFTIEEEAKKGA